MRVNRWFLYAGVFLIIIGAVMRLGPADLPAGRAFERYGP